MKIKSVKIVKYDKKYVYDLRIKDNHNYFVGKSEVNVHNSGKTFVAKGLFGIPNKLEFSQSGLKMLNQDQEFEMLLRKYFDTVDLDDMPEELFNQLTDPSYEDYSGLRSHAKELTVKRLEQYKKGRLGVIIDGTGHKYSAIKDRKDELEKLGYDCFMVFVNTSLEVAKERNSKRARVVPDNILVPSWEAVQSNIGKFQGLFKSNFKVVDNSKQYPDEGAAKKAFNKLVKGQVTKFMNKPIKNKIAKDWIKKEKLIPKKGLAALLKKMKK